MTTPKRKNNGDVAGEVVQYGRDLVEAGNRRRVIIRRADGTKMLDVTVTVAAAAIVVALFVLPFSWWILAIAVFAGIALKLRVEVLREITGGDDIDGSRIDDRYR